MIILIRHAEPQNIGEMDEEAPLSNIGVIQAYETGRFLEENVLNQSNSKVNIYCSPMLRAIQTAQLLHSTIGYMVEPIEIENCLRERYAGLFTRVDEHSRSQLFPSQTRFFNYQKSHNKFYTSMPGGESPYDLNVRLKPFTDRCKNYLNNDQHCIIIAHAKTILILKKLFCQYDDIWYNQLKFEPAYASIHILSLICTNHESKISEEVLHANQISMLNRFRENMITDTIIFEPSSQRTCFSSENIQSACVFHFRKKIWLAERICFRTYFGNQSLEVRPWAHITRKGTVKVTNPVDLQFECAQKWLNHMMKDGQKLIISLINGIRKCSLEQFETIIITYPAGSNGVSKNILPLVSAETIKNKLVTHISQDAKLSSYQLTIIVKPAYQLTKSSHSQFNFFLKTIARSYYDVSLLKGKVIVTDDDVTTGASISEMICACAERNRVQVIACAVAALVPGCEILRINLKTEEVLRQILGDYERPYIKIMKKMGMIDGISSLTSMMAIYQIATSSDGEITAKIIPNIWPMINGQDSQLVKNSLLGEPQRLPILKEFSSGKNALNICEQIDNLTKKLCNASLHADLSASRLFSTYTSTSK